MNINDLTQDEALELLNTDFGSEMEKEASAIVEAEELMEYGAEMAKEAAANLEANYSEDSEDSEESEKVAQADYSAELIQEGFVSELMKLGEANYGDPMIYLEEMAKEAGIADKATKMFNTSKKYLAHKGRLAKDTAMNLGAKAKADASKAKFFAGRTVMGKSKGIAGKANRVDALKALLKTRTGQAGAGALALGGGTGAYKLSQN